MPGDGRCLAGQARPKRVNLTKQADRRNLSIREQAGTPHDKPTV